MIIPLCDSQASGNHTDSNPASYGEEIIGSLSNYEWKADLNNGDTSWSACLGVINVQFAALNPSHAAMDTTSWQSHNVPSAVRLADFDVRQANDWRLLLPAAVLLLLGLIMRIAGISRQKLSNN